MGWHPDWMDTPAFQHEMRLLKRRERIVNALTLWMKHIPVVGHYVCSFWYLLLYEGPYQTLKPRWGGITFGYLNDGMRPTVWHTWRQVTRNHLNDPLTGIYVGGAPHSLREAILLDERWLISGPLDPIELGERLYWSNEDGWVSKSTATVFNGIEMLKSNLPIEAHGWERIDLLCDDCGRTDGTHDLEVEH